MIEILAYIGYFILLLNLIFFFISFSNQGKAYKIFTLYLGLVFVVQILAEILNQQKRSNLFLSHFYFIGQFIILSFFFLAILKEKHQKKIVKLGLLFGLLALGIQYANDISLFFRFNLFEIFITSFLLIIYATFHFYNMLNEKKEFYYINMGILLYLFGSTILFLVGNLTIGLSLGLRKTTWILNAFLYIVYQMFILVEWKKSFSNKTRQ
ncbi:hypothetical protein E0I26_03780 [Flavobacterium rhamnosiphilum]|uniref:YhhN-like protein n=1 Tax=Flavobacterium rhamnosiphilum TaxID=2541724 RepID=A0A4R5FBI9_9FLAO|nr:hypothetical protein [Flavobacterium rhamnosiphilum]TDE45817.1 hypothetical protein E0I26_03780 [Flavobacterium rhamnosiphilum]